jgi:hypothetical protein
MSPYSQTAQEKQTRMRRALRAALVLAALALSACGYAVANPSPPATLVAVDPPYAAITAGVRSSLAQQNIATIGEGQIEVEAIAGNAARARIYPEDPASTDPAWVFVKLDQGLWTVVAGPGTAFTAADMQAAGLPESLLPTQ